MNFQDTLTHFLFPDLSLAAGSGNGDETKIKKENEGESIHDMSLKNFNYLEQVKSMGSASNGVKPNATTTTPSPNGLNSSSDFSPLSNFKRISPVLKPQQSKLSQSIIQNSSILNNNSNKSNENNNDNNNNNNMMVDEFSHSGAGGLHEFATSTGAGAGFDFDPLSTS
ncbi:unnamed protein product, partial [Ambrosiozyma monospora]